MSPVRPMRMRHHNGDATTSGSKISVNRGIGQYIRISNLDSTNDLEVSFNGGRDFYTIQPGDPPLEVNALFYFVRVRSSSSTVKYSAIIGEG